MLEFELEELLVSGVCFVWEDGGVGEEFFYFYGLIEFVWVFMLWLVGFVDGVFVWLIG